MNPCENLQARAFTFLLKPFTSRTFNSFVPTFNSLHTLFCASQIFHWDAFSLSRLTFFWNFRLESSATTRHSYLSLCHNILKPSIFAGTFYWILGSPDSNLIFNILKQSGGLHSLNLGVSNLWLAETCRDPLLSTASDMYKWHVVGNGWFKTTSCFQQTIHLWYFVILIFWRVDLRWFEFLKRCFLMHWWLEGGLRAKWPCGQKPPHHPEPRFSHPEWHILHRMLCLKF